MVAVAIAKERTPAELRALARRERDGRVSARLLALANALDGMSRGGFTELTLDPAEGRGKTRVGGDRDGASGCLPGLRRGGADQVRPRLRPAALALQGLRPAVHPHHPARQAGRDEAGGSGPLLHRAVAERDRQAAGRLGAERDALGQGPRPGALPQAGAGRAGGRGRDRRGLALRPKKASKLWI